MSATILLGNLPDLLTILDIAALLRVDRRTIHCWATTGLLPKPIKLGRCTRWRKHEIERFLADR